MKKYVALLLSIILVISLSSCGSPSKESAADENKPDDIVVIEEPTEETKEKEATLYFVNKEFIETGDMKLDILIEETRMVKYDDTSFEEALVRELMRGPENQNLSTEIPSSAKLISVEVADGTAFVNFDNEGLYGGSFQEMLTISQITNTLAALPNIDKIQFLIDGNKADTFMGHMSIMEPFEGGYKIEE